MIKVLGISVLWLLFVAIKGDLYIQQFRGSNNRLDERGRDRANGNRLFDSQNNDRGGYNVGKLTVYVGEQVPISWTNQHGSGTYQVEGTEIIVQYACDELMRDGTTTNRIPDTPSQCANYNCDEDVEYGRHESFTSYQYCKATFRNKGLFTANQNLQGNSAKYTRQNPDGTRRGYECPEERDYYPYWRSSIWRDIIIYTNDIERCVAYQAESENVKERYECKFDDDYWDEVLNGYYSSGTPTLPLNQTACENAPTFQVPSTNQTKSKYYWTTTEPWDIDAPDCTLASTTRTNHHGLIGGRNYWTYTWTVPDPRVSNRENMDGYVGSFADASCCVIRMRYNITTSDYKAWASEGSINPGVNYLNNSNKTNPDADEDPAEIYIWENFGLTRSDVNYSFTNTDPDSDDQRLSRGYVFRNNPRVDPFGDKFTLGAGPTEVRVQLQLAIDTSQFGRTFEDRTHCFQILDTPSSVGDSTIKLLSVQGKRGNIVQVYPATEYFFVPEPLQVSPGDYVHFCWTGSNTNPENNDGQGREGTDRSNICPLTQAQYSKELYSDVDNNYLYEQTGSSYGDLGNSYPDYVEQPSYGLPEYYNYANKRAVTPADMAGFDINVIKALCTTRRIDSLSKRDTEIGGLDYGNMEELDDAGTTFCIPPQLVKDQGRWNFLCTRNNNFSNRDQKSTLVVADASTFTVSASTLGGTYSSGSGEAILVINSGMIEDGNTLEFSVTTWANTGGESTIIEIAGVDGGEFSSETLTDNGWLQLWIPYTPKSLNSPVIYYRASSSDKWKSYKDGSIEYSDSTYYAVTNIGSGGYYKAANEPNVWAVLSIVVGLLAFGIAITYVFVMKCNRNFK